MTTLACHIYFPEVGVQWPLRENAVLKLYDHAHRCVGTASGAIVLALLRHHLDGLALQAVLGEELDRRKPLAMLPRRGAFSETQRETFRARRRTRKL